MLNKEQTDYIDSLRITHPNVPDATLRPLFVEAGWQEDEIVEALTRYTRATSLTPPVPKPVTPTTPQTQPATLQPRVQEQASPVKQPAVLTPIQAPAPIAPEKSGFGKFLLILGILLIITAILLGMYFYLVQKENMSEVMRSGNIIFKSILEKI